MKFRAHSIAPVFPRMLVGLLLVAIATALPSARPLSRRGILTTGAAACSAALVGACPAFALSLLKEDEEDERELQREEQEEKQMLTDLRKLRKVEQMEEVRSISAL